MRESKNWYFIYLFIFTGSDILTLLQFTVKAGEGDFLKRCDGLNSPDGEESNLKFYMYN